MTAEGYSLPSWEGRGDGSEPLPLRFEISFDALEDGVLGSTRSYSNQVAVSDVYAGLAATGTTALDAVAVANLSKLNAGGGLTIRTNNYFDVANKVGLQDATTTRTGNATINNYLDVNQSVVKALGLTNVAGPMKSYDVGPAELRQPA